MEKVEAYKSSDGNLFLDREECIEHENFSRLFDQLNNFSSNYFLCNGVE